MKTPVKSILLMGAVAMGAHALMAAQPLPADNQWLDQFYKAKLGRSSPMTEARVKAEGATTAFREEITPAVAGPANPWLEQFYRAKLGRNSSMEDARVKAEGQNTAFREETTREAQPANNWFEQFYKAKYGRVAPK